MQDQLFIFLQKAKGTLRIPHGISISSIHEFKEYLFVSMKELSSSSLKNSVLAQSLQRDTFLGESIKRGTLNKIIKILSKEKMEDDLGNTDIMALCNKSKIDTNDKTLIQKIEKYHHGLFVKLVNFERLQNSVNVKDHRFITGVASVNKKEYVGPQNNDDYMSNGL